MMTEKSDDIVAVRESIDRERNNLLTVVAALSFLCICLTVTLVSLGAYSVSAINEREAVSIALDDQRRQYFRCVDDQTYTSGCSSDLVSPSSRDIKRDIEGSGFAEILYISDSRTTSNSEAELEEIQDQQHEAFGILGYVIYGESN